MPLKTGELTRREQDFAHAYVECGMNRQKAERAAGYAPGSGITALARPAVIEMIDQILMARLGEVAAAGTKWALDAFKPESKVADGTKARLLDTALKYRLAAKETAEKDPADMSAAELAAAIETLEKIKAGQAQDVTPAAPEAGAEPDPFA